MYVYIFIYLFIYELYCCIAQMQSSNQSLVQRHLKGRTSIRNKAATVAGQHINRKRGHTFILPVGFKSLPQYSSVRRQHTPQTAWRLWFYFYLYQVLTSILYYQRLKSSHSFAGREDIFEHHKHHWHRQYNGRYFSTQYHTFRQTTSINHLSIDTAPA